MVLLLLPRLLLRILRRLGTDVQVLLSRNSTTNNSNNRALRGRPPLLLPLPCLCCLTCCVCVCVCVYQRHEESKEECVLTLFFHLNPTEITQQQQHRRHRLEEEGEMAVGQQEEEEEEEKQQVETGR